jgi:hypothetical protein
MQFVDKIISSTPLFILLESRFLPEDGDMIQTSKRFLNKKQSDG